MGKEKGCALMPSEKCESGKQKLNEEKGDFWFFSRHWLELLFGTRANWKQGACLRQPPGSLYLSNRHSSYSREGKVCARHVDASPPNPPGCFEGRLPPSGRGSGRWACRPGNHQLSPPEAPAARLGQVL